jgi:hypothetical protein
VSDDASPIPPRLLERVAASAAGIAASDDLEADIKTHRARGQRTVLEYRFDNDLRLFAKRYPERRDVLASYEVLRALWERGFGPGSRHRVAEPLGCFADWGVLLMRAAPGHRLSALAERPEPWEEGLRAAAGWLAQLHASSVSLGPRGDLAQGVFRLARRAARASAHHPELEGLLVRLIEELAVRAGNVGSGSEAQTHGRYHAGHVFVAPETVTVIDLDRVARGDPAIDVGEFLHRVRMPGMRARLGHDLAERAPGVFLDGYNAHAHGVPGSLLYYWSYSILSTLFRLLELDHEKWEKRLETYRAELADIPQRVGALGGVP